MKLSHLDADGQPRMVDVGGKAVTARRAVAEARVRLSRVVTDQFTDGDLQTRKGPVIQTAIIAGTQGVKRTADLVPFCHPLAISGCEFETGFEDRDLVIRCQVSLEGRTGVEMEALTGASVAALTVYDMLKGLNEPMQIHSIRVLEKIGGKTDTIMGQGGA